MDRSYLPLILVAHFPLLEFLWIDAEPQESRAFLWLYDHISIGHES